MNVRLVPILCFLIAANSSWGQINRSVDSLDGVGVEEHLGAKIPRELEFRDSTGALVRLKDLFDDRIPVILSLNYSDCPMLCQLQLNGLVDGLSQLRLRVGLDVRVVSVSIDPNETTAKARQAKQRYVQMYGDPESKTHWHFLTGSKANIQELADTVGFQFRYVPERQEYAHAAVAILCTPDGTISRYLYGVHYERLTLKMAIVEAGRGEIGSTIDQILLFCFHYDADSGRYAPQARQIMKLGGALMIGALAILMIPYWLRRGKRGSTESDASNPRERLNEPRSGDRQ